jgi:hypothetical protein
MPVALLRAVPILIQDLLIIPRHRELAESLEHVELVIF